MKRTHLTGIACLLLGIVNFWCEKTIGPITNNSTGGSEVVGTLVLKTGGPAKDAQVIANRVLLDSAGIDSLVFVKGVFADISGNYKFDSLDTGKYILACKAVNNQDTFYASINFHLDSVASPKQATFKDTIGVDTLYPPGSISGQVSVNYPVDLRHIIINIPGLSYNVYPDSNGTFKISNIPVDTYAVHFSYNGADFSLVDTQVKNIIVRSSLDSNIGLIKMHLSSTGDPPMPLGLTAIYDPLSGSIALSWGAVPVPDFRNFILWRENSNNSAGYVQIDSTRDTFFVDRINFTDTVGYSVFYKVQCFDSSGGKSQVTPAITINANPPSGKTVDSLKAPDSAGVLDKIAVIANFTNITSPVKTIIWTTSYGDSVHSINNKIGSDTLRISFTQAAKQTIYFKAIDNLGRTSEDSAFVTIVQDKPVIAYISPSQTIGFGGMVQCSLAISHRFGACTLSVHLGNSLKDFKRSYTALSIVYDTAFSTLQALTWDSVIIKVTDSHGNSINTGFAVTILQPIHDQWEDMSFMNDHHSCHASEVINDTLYVISGFKAKKPYGETPVATVEAYDTSHKSWVNKSPLQYPRYNFMSCVFNDKICVFGGFNGNNYVPYMEQYDPQTNAWTVFDSMHVGKVSISRQASASCLAGSKLYVFGGTTISNDSSSDSVCQNIYMYDFSKNSWSESARKMLSPRSDFRAIQVGGKIYLIGGDDANQQALSSIEVFDTLTQICSIGPITLPIALSDFGAAMIGQKLYIIGGLTSNGEPANSTYMMDFSLIPNTWSNKAALSSSRFYMSASALDGNIYIAGGVTSFNDLLQFGTTVDQDFIKYYP